MFKCTEETLTLGIPLQNSRAVIICPTPYFENHLYTLQTFELHAKEPEHG